MGTWHGLNRNRLSHAYILMAPTQEQCHTMEKQLAMAALCDAEGEAACGKCRNCRKVEQGIHPDVIYVRCLTNEKGQEKQEIQVDQIRQLIADAEVLPNEAERKLYVIQQAHKMNLAAQNAALKLLEEPPARLILALSTDNAEGLLPTVRSRCVELCGVREEAAEGEQEEQAELYLRCLAKKDSWELLRFCMGLESMDNRSLQQFLQTVQNCAADTLCARRHTVGLSQRQLLEISQLAERCIDYLKANTGVKHILGLLAVKEITKEQ